jgi:hypothetical protein
MEEHKAHLDEQIGHLALQLLGGRQHSVSLMAEEHVIQRAEGIQKQLFLNEAAIRQIMEYALLQGIEILEWRLTRHPDCENYKRELAMYIQTGIMTWLPST